MVIQPVSARTITVENYRELLAQRLRTEVAVGSDLADHAELVFNLTRLLHRLTKDFEVLHRQRGWSWAGFRIMNVLWVLGAAEVRDVARLSGSSRAAVSSALNPLERDGLVSRTRDAVDRRLVHLQLTERGRSALQDAMREQADREQAWLSVLDRADQQRLTLLLACIADRETPPCPQSNNDR